MADPSDAGLAEHRLRSALDHAQIGGRVAMTTTPQGPRIRLTLTPANADELSRILTGRPGVDNT